MIKRLLKKLLLVYFLCIATQGLFAAGFDGGFAPGPGQVTGDLIVGGDATLSGTLDVTGAATFNADVGIATTTISAQLHIVSTKAPSEYIIKISSQDATDIMGITGEGKLIVKGIIALSDGSTNVIIGELAGDALTTGSANMLLGYRAGNSLASGVSNVLIGLDSGLGLTGSENSIIGRGAGTNMTSADGNIIIGNSTGDGIITGDKNIFIGYNIDSVDSSVTKTLNIGNLLFGTGLDGSGRTLSSGHIGISTRTPTAQLHIVSNSSPSEYIVKKSSQDGTIIFGITGDGAATFGNKLTVNGTFYYNASSAEIAMQDNTDGTTVTTSTSTFVQIEGTYTSDDLIGFTVDGSSFTYTGLGGANKKFKVDCNASLLTNQTNTIAHLAVYKNGTKVSFSASRKIAVSGDEGNHTIIDTLRLSQGDIVQIRVSGDKSATITAEHITIIIHQLN